MNIKIGKFLFSIVCAFTLIATTNVAQSVDRFAPVALSTGIDEFYKRLKSSNTNTDFIIAQVLNNARQIERAGESFQNNASLYRNDGTDNSAISNSVIIPPGTRADTIIIINQNDGDSYAIQR